jgi:hypothetical protein
MSAVTVCALGLAFAEAKWALLVVQMTASDPTTPLSEQLVIVPVAVPS